MPIIHPGVGSGDMTKAVYDAANIGEQLVGLTTAQNLSNKTFTTLAINAATVTLSQDTNFVLSGGVNGVSFATNVLSIDGTNNRVGIGTTAPAKRLTLVASGSAVGASDGAVFELEQQSTGDVALTFLLTATRRWLVGVDNSDSDKFKISEANAGDFTSTAFAMDVSGNVVLGAALNVTGTTTLATSLTGVLRTDSGVVSVDSDVTDIVSVATTSAAGKVELAITSEIDTGTDSTRAIPVDQFVASARNVRYIIWRVLDPTTDWPANGTTTVGGDLEFPFTGTITEIGAFVDTAGTTGTAVVDVNIGGATIMTTNKLSFDSTEKTTRTAATPPTLTTTAVTAGNIFTVDVDTNFTTKAKGLTIRLGVRLT